MGRGITIFFYSGWAGTHTDKCRMHAQVEFAFDIARPWKIFAVSCKGGATFMYF
jgi:hypothetical protein